MENEQVHFCPIAKYVNQSERGEAKELSRTESECQARTGGTAETGVEI